jgi:hypothetical protein
VTSVPSITASSPGAQAVLIASLATVIMQPDVCCDPDSALEAQIPPARKSVAKRSRREITRQALSRERSGDRSGRPILVGSVRECGGHHRRPDRTAPLIARLERPSLRTLPSRIRRVRLRKWHNGARIGRLCR